MLEERQILALFILLSIITVTTLTTLIWTIYINILIDRLREHLDAIRDLRQTLEMIASHIEATVSTLQTVESQMKVVTERLDDLISKENRHRRRTLISQATIASIGTTISTATFLGALVPKDTWQWIVIGSGSATFAVGLGLIPLLAALQLQHVKNARDITTSFIKKIFRSLTVNIHRRKP